LHLIIKAGVVNFTKSLASLAPKIRVIAICPSFSPTNILSSSPAMLVGLKGVKLVPVELVVDAFVRGIEDTSLAGTCLRVTPQYGIDVYPAVKGLKGKRRRKRGLARL
jgi:NAD(P)-dependent dehydrogenase (short-subunit alcohol dehydrogenase family)